MSNTLAVTHEEIDHTREGLMVDCPECDTHVFINILTNHGCHECGIKRDVLIRSGESVPEDGEIIGDIEGEVMYAVGIAGNVRATVEYDVPTVYKEAWGLDRLTDLLEDSPPTWTIRAVQEDE